MSATLAERTGKKRERTRVGNKQLTHMYTITVSMVSFLGSVCLPLCLFAGSLVVGQGRPAATG